MNSSVSSGTVEHALETQTLKENGDPHSSRRTENRDLTQAQASRHLSPTIATKQLIFTVNLTVKLKWCREKPSVFKLLRVLETASTVRAEDIDHWRLTPGSDLRAGPGEIFTSLQDITRHC